MGDFKQSWFRTAHQNEGLGVTRQSSTSQTGSESLLHLDQPLLRNLAGQLGLALYPSFGSLNLWQVLIASKFF